MKSQVLHTVWCNISGEAAGELWNWSPLGVKGLNLAHLEWVRSSVLGTSFGGGGGGGGGRREEVTLFADPMIGYHKP